MSGKRRVYEVARDMGMDNKAFVALLESLGVPEVKNHMSVMTPEAEERVKRHFQKGTEASADAASDARSGGGVIKRRAGAVVRRKKTSDEEGGEAHEEAPHAAEHPSDEGHSHPEASHTAHEPVAEKPEPVAAAPVQAPSPAESTVVESASAKSDSSSEAPAVANQPSAHRAPETPSSGSVESSSQAHPAAAAEPDAPPVQPEPELSAPAAVSAPVVEIPPAPPVPDVKSALPNPAPAPVAPPPTATTTPSQSPNAGSSVAPGARPSQVPPKRGIEVWEGRPGVPMSAPRPAAPRRVQYDPKAAGPGNMQRRPGGPMGGGPGSGPMSAGPVQSGQGGRGGPAMRGKPRGIGSFGKARGAGAPVTKERAAHKKVVRIEETVQLQSLAGSMGVKATDLLRKLFQLGMTGININSTLDADTAKIVATEFGWEVEDVAVSEAEQLQKAQGFETEVEDEGLLPRPPVVTVMGHVDHGKTSLLDAIRQTNVVTGEAGGITQHIGAYSVETPHHGRVTFLDTPGHAAFTQMRARGAQATDLVVLVVAADDGVMPQTREAISHAKAAGVPIVVAINKCDKPDAQPERVRRELADLGLIPEEWGGETLFVEVSAHTRKGIDELLDRIALQAEVMELRSNPDKLASGIVVESQLDRGRGPVATVLVTEGTLNLGDVVLAGASFGKVRAMHDWDGRNLKSVGPSGPCAIVGLSEVPRAGDQVYVVKDVKTAQAIADTRKVKERRSLAPSAGNKPRTLEDIARLMSESEQLELKVIVKADVAGSAEAVADSLVQLSTEKVRVGVVLQAAGAITENDVNLAVAAGAIIVGFNAKPAGKAQSVAQREGIEIRQYSIIYNLLDDVRLAMEGLLAPKLVEREIGRAEVRQTFRISRAGTVAGSMVIDGVVRRTGVARLFRDGEQIWEGKLSGLKRFKEDVKEVKDGFECGISLDGMDEIHVGDQIVCFEVEHVKQSL